MNSFLDRLSNSESPSSDSSRPSPPVPIALTIAGSDSGGGAGIQADLKTFAANRVFGTSVLTLLTAQNTLGVTELAMVSGHMVRAQFQALISDLPPRAAKTGALGSTEMIALLAELLQDDPIHHLVVDPVMISKHGDPLMGEKAQKELATKILPLALVVTPNRFEAAALIGGRDVESLSEMKDAARRIFDSGPRHVLIKGGHFDKIVRDILFDGTGFIEFGADRVDSKALHGSGCTFSAAITARLARGDTLPESIAYAREFISAAIEFAPPIGRGISPVNPMYAHWK